MLALWIALGVLAAVLLLFILPSLLVAYVIYHTQFTRYKKDMWNREKCTFPKDAEAVAMFDTALSWAKENENVRESVQTVSEGLHLYGEYFNFGFDKAVLILSGRTEASTYACYYARPYRKLGYNVLVIDARSHGKSEGKYNCVGLREYRDVLAWIDLLIREKKNTKVLLHGICIGSATAMYAITDPSCPGEVQGIITDGMFVNFYETFKNHIISFKKPVFPVLQMDMWFIRLHAGRDPKKNGPLTCIDRLNKPILMLFGKQDIFSLPEKSVQLYEKCRADKTLVWFEEGGHSHIRFHAPEKYDGAIAEFVKEKLQ